MAIEIKSIPTLKGDKAVKFTEKIQKESSDKWTVKKSHFLRKATKDILEKARI